MSTLYNEFLDAAEAVTPAVARALGRSGIAFITDNLPRYGIARIRAEGDLYEPDDEGIPALLTADLIGGIDCEVIIEDIVATVLGGASRSYRRRGQIDALGDAAIEAARHRRTSVMIHKSPFSWLAGNRTGACLINWQCDPRYVFRDISDLRCETDQIARRLTARIAECSLAAPRVSVIRHRRAA